MRATLLLLLVVASAAATFSLTAHAAVPGHHRAASCLPLERDALLEFKRGITGDSAGHLASWQKGDADCCRWRGVRCSNKTGHVLGLHLRSVVPSVYTRNMYSANPDPFQWIDDTGTTVLSGQISPSLLSLQHLEHLDLSMNNLSGPAGRMPGFLGLLKNLRYLNLSNMPFSGRVPPQLGNLSKLHYLDLSRNDYMFVPSIPNLYSTDISWLSNLPLRYLDLGSVNLKGAVDWALAVNMVPSLKVLRLPGCSLISANQSLPHLNLTNLVEFSLSLNDQLFNPVASCWFWNLTSLQHLELSETVLHGQIPQALGGMTSLRVLDFSYNSFQSIMTASMSNLCNLEILDLTYNKLSGNIMELLPQCTTNKLKELRLSQNNFTGVLPNWIGRLWPSLLVLELHGNQFNGYVPYEIGMLNNLFIFDISHNQFDGPLPTEIGMLNNLNIMDLSRNNLTGVITHQHFANLTSLTVVDLSDNFLKIVVDPGWLPPFTLAHASFASCQMGPLFPAWLHTQADIIYLNLSSASIVDRLPHWFVTSFSKAGSVDISNNGIKGPLPQHLSNLTGMKGLSSIDYPSMTMFKGDSEDGRRSTDMNLSVITKGQQLYYMDLQFYAMVSIDLSRNRLTGGIPREITALDGIINLNLSWNHLSGKIPDKIGVMNALESLDLKENKIYGDIPQSLTNLTYLSYLDLSYNNLTGRIPSGGQLDTLYMQHPFMYDGNIGLCGKPLHKNCSDNSEPKHGDYMIGEHDSVVMSFSYGLGIGYVVGFWLVFCILLFKKSWRVAYFSLFDKAHDEVYVFVTVTWARLAQKETTN
ncbi:hypothetical protein EJB05_57918, partial [Eragrostis curvula]